MKIEPIRVLLVEDNPADARLLQEALVDVGVRRSVDLVNVTRLSAAIELLSREQFDVILLDLSLPDEHGIDTLLRVRAHAPSLPIVVLSGMDDEALMIRAVREGAQDYLVKGIMDGHVVVRAMRYAMERKHAIEALQRREEHFRSLIEQALDLISILNSDGTIRYASPSHERLLGYRSDELIGANVLSFVHSEDVSAVAEAFQGEGVTNSIECRFRHKNGSWRVLDIFGRNLYHVPSVEGVVVNARDVTERKHVENALREANQTLRAVIHTSPLAIYSTDLEGRVKSWNRAAYRTFGWAEWELLDQPVPHFADDVEQILRKRFEQAERAETDIAIQTRCHRKDGSALDVNIWSALLRDGAGSIKGIVDVVADVTERKRLEELLHHSQRLEAVGRLAGGVAHDFNNLLMVISGYSQLLTEEIPTGHRAHGDLHQVIKAAERATDLTKQLLAFSRRQVVSPRMIDLNALVNDMERMLRRIFGEEIRVSTTLDPDLKRVHADPGQLEQVILNLALNARDAMPGGGTLTIRSLNAQIDEAHTRKHLSPPPGEYSVLEISDTGLGIDPEVQTHLFEPFLTTKEKGKGTGLGLSTSYGIVKQTGGEITFTSEPGRGTTFRIYLPAGVVQPEPVEPTPRKAVPRGTETILLVEDDEAVRGVIETILTRSGYRVLCSASPQDALDLLTSRSVKIDLMITDVVMPGLSGPELAERIVPLSPGLRVLYVSGYMDSNARPQSGAFLQKPFPAEALASKVREVLASEVARPS
jgi:two-component system cell cycle sensor histidine kinase/response regulator CckA